jgi:hypothetical protein
MFCTLWNRRVHYRASRIHLLARRSQYMSLNRCPQTRFNIILPSVRRSFKCAPVSGENAVRSSYLARAFCVFRPVIHLHLITLIMSGEVQTVDHFTVTFSTAFRLVWSFYFPHRPVLNYLQFVFFPRNSTHQVSHP